MEIPVFEKQSLNPEGSASDMKVNIQDRADQVIGKSQGGKDIHLYIRGSGKLPVLLFGGVHGDESEGFLFAEKLVEEIDARHVSLPEGVQLYVIPRMNPDGCEVLRRTNQRNVDLNRNLPTHDWVGDFKNVRYFPGESAGSEAESILTVDLIETVDPATIISLHSYEHAMVNFNGESENLANAMSEKNGLPPKGDIGYPTPGSLGTYAGWERNLPTITLEFFRGDTPENIWETQLDGVLAGISFYLENPIPQRKKI